jgi:hypothetical protein
LKLRNSFRGDRESSQRGVALGPHWLENFGTARKSEG